MRCQSMRGFFISIHAPPRGATNHATCEAGEKRYFNSRPSARGDVSSVLHPYGGDISIHAPPRGATVKRAHGWHSCRISIHAPPRGATWRCWEKEPTREISIHAPPRGATRRRRLGSAGKLYFNSRPSARGDPCTALHGGAFFYFNSRPSARGDAVVLMTHSADLISIHAPPRGATFAASRN